MPVVSIEVPALCSTVPTSVKRGAFSYAQSLSHDFNNGVRTYTSDTITDSNALQAALKGSLHDYPDVQYSMSWVTFADNSQIKNNIEIGNTGWLRDRYGLDVNVKIQSYTHYLDKQSGNSDTITFGNKIFDASEYESRQRKAQDQAKMIANLQWKINTAKSVGNAWTESEVQVFDSSKRN